MRYSPFEFLPQDNTGKVADESQAEEAVKAHGVQSENSKSGRTHHPWKRLGFLSVELNVNLMSLRRRPILGLRMIKKSKKSFWWFMAVP